MVTIKCSVWSWQVDCVWRRLWAAWTPWNTRWTLRSTGPTCRPPASPWASTRTPSTLTRHPRPRPTATSTQPSPRPTSSPPRCTWSRARRTTVRWAQEDTGTRLSTWARLTRTTTLPPPDWSPTGARHRLQKSVRNASLSRLQRPRHHQLPPGVYLATTNPPVSSRCPSTLYPPTINPPPPNPPPTSVDLLPSSSDLTRFKWSLYIDLPLTFDILLLSYIYTVTIKEFLCLPFFEQSWTKFSVLHFVLKWFKKYLFCSLL